LAKQKRSKTIASREKTAADLVGGAGFIYRQRAVYDYGFFATIGQLALRLNAELPRNFETGKRDELKDMTG